MIRQRTIKSSVTTTGIGLHKGEKVTLTLRPAADNTGIVFLRTDLSPVAEFLTTPELVGDTQMCTCLINDQNQRLSTTEHLMAAIASLSIDNLIVEVDSAEIPIMDGSSLPFIFLLQEAEVVEQKSLRRYIKITKPVRVEIDDKWAELRPYDGFKIDFQIEFDHPIISKSAQRIIVDITAESFLKEVSRARTFGFMRDIEYLRNNNLALGGNMDNAIVLDEYRVLNPDGLRYDDEFVKHKILDAVGDLYMTGKPLLAEFVAFKSGHDLNNKVLVELMKNQDCWEYVTFENETPELVSQSLPQLA
ncbi:UDP-3-O-acyl-N-acetylglucosamine deacetylase [Psychrosphaera sp. F3M07]|uniref:UDP-3-O-acyl-N-acetylglucosamine deacetylase n=1 Tax=Psychrosphaera sp. F3M07 TaxID=2841560 RepID=UPI001C091127|nr:UDP-3-O-acyl-N-acetylglucosamine deacetylase [Psychrosphaera sp. F3M07]MBU2916824.1 UDP-3-O-acyl-N-acetylglucosamine deacetylase [Psychrosphaera sp. F3M07]